MNWSETLGSQIAEPWTDARYRAFDFWIGEWDMTWRDKPEGKLHFNKDGDQMHHRVFPVLGGKAIVELAWARDAVADAPSIRGFSIRYFDPTRERWVMAQNWPRQGNDGQGFTDQLIGFEDNGRLSMYSVSRRPADDGGYEHFKRQYNFTDIRKGVFRWDGSNSYDEGASWEMWNVVDARRTRALDPFGKSGTAWPGYLGGKLCPDSPHGSLDFLEGEWTGVAQNSAGIESPARMSVGRILDGCAVVSVITTDGGPRIFAATAYVPEFDKWLTYVLDDRRGTGHHYRWSPEVGEGATFYDAPSLAIVDEFTPFLSDEAFDKNLARHRNVWKRFNNDSFEIEVQARIDSNASWITETTYAFSR